MDEDGRGDRPPVTIVPGDRAPAGRKAVVAGRLDHWWDPAWDAAWWDPAWSADRPAGAPAPVAATSQPGGAVLAANSAGPGTLARLPDASPGHMARPAAGHVAEPAVAVPAGSAVAVPAGTAAVPQPPPAAAADPSWSQVLTTTISLRMSRRRPQAGITGRPSAARVPEALVPGVPARRSRLAAWGRAVPVRLLAASMLGAGLLAVGAGTAGLLTASGSPTASVRWAARPSPLPEPSGRTVGPALLATVQQTARPVWLSVPAIGVRTPPGRSRPQPERHAPGAREYHGGGLVHRQPAARRRRASGHRRSCRFPHRASRLLLAADPASWPADLRGAR